MEKTLFEKITEIYSELTGDDFHPVTGSIHLLDDSDGLGTYIAKWEYPKPIPQGLTLGK